MDSSSVPKAKKRAEEIQSNDQKNTSPEKKRLAARSKVRPLMVGKTRGSLEKYKGMANISIMLRVKVLTKESLHYTRKISDDNYELSLPKFVVKPMHSSITEHSITTLTRTLMVL